MNESKINPTKKCTLCSENASRIYEGMSGYVEGTKYDVYECSNCSTQFVDPMSNLKEEYDIIYGDQTIDGTGYYHYLAKGVKSLRNPLKDLFNYSAIFWGVIKAVEDNSIKRGAKILEVGSGLGYLTYAFNKSGYDCQGLDYSDTATNFANNFFGKNFTQGTIDDFSMNNKDKYDVVIATEVIEHVVNPGAFIENCLKVLKSGGILILTTPIKDIHPKGVIWETEPAPVHLWWFTEKGIESVAKHFNAKASFVDFTDYTKNKVWHVHVGVVNMPPHSGPVVNKNRLFIHPKKKGYRDMLMDIIPAWLYIKLVCLYHDMKFLQRNKKPSRYMYGMCAVIEKP
ncbi:MAG: class I SAM-dependent methyltransferase [Candidatus Paceibacterota bacterium]